MSEGISQQQQAIIGLIEKKGPMEPLKIWAELDISSKGEYTPSFSNLCRCVSGYAKLHFSPYQRQGP